MLSKKDIEWLAGVFDGDGSFEFRVINNKRCLHMISLTQNVRDINILYRVKDLLKFGKIRYKSKNICRYRVMHKEGMLYLIKLLNGEIRLKVDSFKESCSYLGLIFKEASYNLVENSSYFAGLVDTDGTVIYNFDNNRIEVHIELKQTDYSLKLNLKNVILGSKCKVYKYVKRNQTKKKVYNYFKENRLYSDFKFYRVMFIKKFLEIRCYKNYARHTIEYQIYKENMLKFFRYKNEHKMLPKYLI